MIKKLLTITVAIFMISLFTACGGSQGSEEKDSNADICDWCENEGELQEVECEGEMVSLCPDCMEIYNDEYGYCDECGNGIVILVTADDGRRLCQDCLHQSFDEADDEEYLGEQDAEYDGSADVQSADMDDDSSSGASDGSDSTDVEPDELIEKNVEDVHRDAVYVDGEVYQEGGDGHNYYYKWKVHPNYSEQGGGYGYLSPIDFTITYVGMSVPLDFGTLTLRIYDSNDELAASKEIQSYDKKEHSFDYNFTSADRTYYIVVEAEKLHSLDVSWTGTGGH